MTDTVTSRATGKTYEFTTAAEIRRLTNAGLISEFDGLDNDQLLRIAAFHAKRQSKALEAAAREGASRNAYIIELAERGVSLREIAAAVGISHTAVAKVCQK